MFSTHQFFDRPSAELVVLPPWNEEDCVPVSLPVKLLKWQAGHGWEGGERVKWAEKVDLYFKTCRIAYLDGQGVLHVHPAQKISLDRPLSSKIAGEGSSEKKGEFIVREVKDIAAEEYGRLRECIEQEILSSSSEDSLSEVGEEVGSEEVDGVSAELSRVDKKSGVRSLLGGIAKVSFLWEVEKQRASTMQGLLDRWGEDLVEQGERRERHYRERLLAEEIKKGNVLRQTLLEERILQEALATC